MHVANFLLLNLLSTYHAHAWWSHECCKCPDLDDDGSFFINFTGGIDEGDAQEAKPASLSKEKRELLDLQNDYRRRVARGQVPGQPSSSKIHDLQWSAELEASAQRHADTCQFAHDSNEARRTAKWDWVGQNIAYSSSVAENVEMWFNEYKDYNYRSNYCSGICGHYTQLVWANTTHVGCGSTWSVTTVRVGISMAFDHIKVLRSCDDFI
ncbi:Venom allergen 5 [Echinococcus granulosus]|uniref:Venom allergen val protein n=1 Tax=Echinococcus granulosus TaxID=6210 RepID=A0A068WCT7_ECHGR|nr:Venom allergen 5 [Echinococcus granulosus]CDS15417.1 venom allergen val protein [Echinococcus granulosus]